MRWMLLIIGNTIEICAAAGKQNDNVSGDNWWMYLLIACAAIFILLCIANFTKLIKWSIKLRSGLKTTIAGKNANAKEVDELNRLIEKSGFAYDKNHDIFYSKIDAWQRKFGYCRLYDEMCAVLGMVIDCEPIYFEYDNKRWLIELWKGQYGMTTGGEVGVYNTNAPDINLPGIFNGTFYDCADDNNLLYISVTLIKNNRKIMERKAKHWWLCGFILGEFSDTSELKMFVRIGFPNIEMRDRFVKAIIELGYAEFGVYQNTVNMLFDKPLTAQPLMRIKELERITQEKNKYLCDEFKRLTSGYNGLPQKLKAVREQSPKLYKAIALGKPNNVFKKHERLIKRVK